MEPHSEDTMLAADLRALRPKPRPEFAAELDARANAGFPRQPQGAGVAAFDRLRARVRRTPRQRLPAFACAAAAAAIVAATAVVALSENDPVDPVTSNSLRLERPATATPYAGPSAELQLGADEPSGLKDSGASAGAAEYGAVLPQAASGPYASRATHRDVERSARIVLGTEVSGVRSAAAKVFETVRDYDGIVMRSSVRDGSAGATGAVFELLIPSDKLGEAMAGFSEIADVRSRSEATLDITAPTIGLEERLRDARATVEGLLAQLAEADTEAERASVEAELRAERRRIATLRSRLTALQRRTNLSRVSLRIETSTATATDAGGSWGVDDGVEEAGRILAIAVGVTVIGLAILTPLALIVLLVWFLQRTWVRARRERALG